LPELPRRALALGADAALAARTLASGHSAPGSRKMIRRFFIVSALACMSGAHCVLAARPDHPVIAQRILPSSWFSRASGAGKWKLNQFKVERRSI